MSGPAGPGGAAVMKPSRVSPGQLFGLIRDAGLAFGQDNVPRLSAALAYYAISAVVPLLLLVIIVAGYFLNSAEVQTQIFSALRTNLGDTVADFLTPLVRTAIETNTGRSLTWPTVLGGVTIFFTATGLFVQLQGSLNSLWGSDPPPALNLWVLIRTRLIAFALVLFFGFLILAFLAGNTYLSAIASRLGDTIGLGAFFVRLGTFALSTLAFTFVFAFLYKFLPQIRLEWREVWVGAAVTALLFSVGQVLIGLYFARAAPSSAYGAAGALFLLLLWIYYSSMIMFFGAEITWVYSQQYGTRAGGVGNLEKKEAVADAGVDIDTAPSAREAEAIAATPQESQRPSQRRAAQRGLVQRGLARVLPQRSPRPARPDTAGLPRAELPSVQATLSHAFVALMAVPAVLALHLLRALRLRR